MVAYNFSKTPIDIDRLTAEINDSSISSASYDYTTYNSPNLSIYFDEELSSEDQTTLSTIVTNHSGEPIFVDGGLVAFSNGSGSIEFSSVMNYDEVTLSGSWGVISNIGFGNNYHYEEEEDVTSTNYNDYLTKVILDTDTVSSGTYRIGWYYEWQRDRTSSDFMARITVDDSAIMNHNEESKDKNDWNIGSGFKHMVLTEGTHSVKLQYCGEVSGNATSFIRKARVEFWRVA